MGVGNPRGELPVDNRVVRLRGVDRGIGDANALYVVGTLATDVAESLRCFQLASAQGHPKAQCNLGVFYEEGRGQRCGMRGDGGRELGGQCFVCGVG